MNVNDLDMKKTYRIYRSGMAHLVRIRDISENETEVYVQGDTYYGWVRIEELEEA